MLDFRNILLDDVLPVLLCAALLTVTWRPWRRATGPVAQWATPLAVGLAFAWSFHSITETWPKWPFTGSQNAVFAVASATALVCTFDGLLRLPNWLRAELALILSAGSAWLVFSPLLKGAWKELSLEGSLWIIAIGVVIHIAWTSAELLATRRHGAWMAFHFVLLGAGTATALGLSDSLQLARLGGAITATMTVALLLGLVLPRFSLGRGAGVVLVPLTVLLFMGYHYVGLDPWNLLLLLVALPLTWMVELDWIARRKAWLRVLLSTLILGAPIFVAVARAHLAFVKVQQEYMQGM